MHAQYGRFVDDLVERRDKLSQVIKGYEPCSKEWWEQLKKAMRLFVKALRRVPDGKTELEQRAGLIDLLCEPGSEYHAAGMKCQEMLRGLERESEGGSRLAKGMTLKAWLMHCRSGCTPILRVEVARERTMLGRVLEVPAPLALTDEQIETVQAWKSACDELLQKTEELAVDGYWYLLNDDAKGVLREGWCGPAELEEIQAAASELCEWAERQGAEKPHGEWLQDLRALAHELAYELDDRETSDPEEWNWPERLETTELYEAVQQVERHYPVDKLPMGPWEAWRVMLRISRRQAGGDGDLHAKYAGYYRAAEKLRAWTLEEIKRAEGEEAGQGAPDERGIAVANEYLFNWREILDALRMKNNEESRRRVREANVEFRGPILFTGKGGQPKAERGPLLRWWNGLLSQWQEQVDQALNPPDREIGGAHKYGRDGIVVPEIRGSVKRRRKKRAENLPKPPKTSQNLPKPRRLALFSIYLWRYTLCTICSTARMLIGG